MPELGQITNPQRNDPVSSESVLQQAASINRASDWKFFQGIDQDYDKNGYSSPNYSSYSLTVGNRVLELRFQAPSFISGHVSDSYHFIIKDVETGEAVFAEKLSEAAFNAYEQLSKNSPDDSQAKLLADVNRLIEQGQHRH